MRRPGSLSLPFWNAFRLVSVHRAVRAAVVASAFGLVVILGLGRESAFANAFVVDTTVDTVDATPGDGVCADASGDCSLRAAVMEANALGGAQSISLAAATYMIAIPPLDDQVDETRGDLDVLTDITITGETRATTIIDGGAISRVLRVDAKRNPDSSILSYGALTLERLTVANGFNDIDSFSGGIMAYTVIDPGVTQLRLTDVSVTGNVGPLGAGIISNVEAEVADSVITSNHGELSGGGLLLVFGSKASLLRVAVADNTLETSEVFDSIGAGIAIGSDSIVAITDSSITGNTSTSARNGEAGGISNTGANLTLNNVIVSGNKALTSTDAFGSFSGGMLNSGGTVVMNGGAITGNCAARSVAACSNPALTAGSGSGGGVSNSGCRNEACDLTGPGNLTLNGVLIDQNYAQDDGGGILNGGGGHVILNGSTLTGNQATGNGGAIWNAATFNGNATRSIPSTIRPSIRTQHAEFLVAVASTAWATWKSTAARSATTQRPLRTVVVSTRARRTA